MKSMDLYERLSAHNEVHDPNQSTDNDEFLEIAMKCLDTEIYLTSVNAMSEKPARWSISTGQEIG